MKKLIAVLVAAAFTGLAVNTFAQAQQPAPSAAPEKSAKPAAKSKKKAKPAKKTKKAKPADGMEKKGEAK
jgi:hypothetical protein